MAEKMSGTTKISNDFYDIAPLGPPEEEPGTMVVSRRNFRAPSVDLIWIAIDELEATWV